MTRPSGERTTAEFSHSISRSSSAASGLDACDSISHSSSHCADRLSSVPGRVDRNDRHHAPIFQILKLETSSEGEP
jgi:hypothetical protein